MSHGRRIVLSGFVALLLVEAIIFYMHFNSTRRAESPCIVIQSSHNTSTACISWRQLGKIASSYRDNQRATFACVQNEFVSNDLGSENGRVCAVDLAVLPRISDLDALVAGNIIAPADAKKGRPLSTRRIGSFTFIRPWGERDHGRATLVSTLSTVQRFKGGPERPLVVSPLLEDFERVMNAGRQKGTGQCATVVNSTAVLVRFDGWNPFHQVVLTFPYLFFTLQSLASGDLDTTVGNSTLKTLQPKYRQANMNFEGVDSSDDISPGATLALEEQELTHEIFRDWVPIIDDFPPEYAAEVPGPFGSAVLWLLSSNAPVRLRDLTRPVCFQNSLVLGGGMIHDWPFPGAGPFERRFARGSEVSPDPLLTRFTEHISKTCAMPLAKLSRRSRSLKSVKTKHARLLNKGGDSHLPRWGEKEKPALPSRPLVVYLRRSGPRRRLLNEQRVLSVLNQELDLAANHGPTLDQTLRNATKKSFASLCAATDVSVASGGASKALDHCFSYRIVDLDTSLTTASSPPLEKDKEDVPKEVSRFCSVVGKISQARVVIGLHEAGLTNALFLPPGSALVEITLDGKPDYWNLMAKAIGTAHFTAPGQVSSECEGSTSNKGDKDKNGSVRSVHHHSLNCDIEVADWKTLRSAIKNALAHVLKSDRL